MGCVCDDDNRVCVYAMTMTMTMMGVCDEPTEWANDDDDDDDVFTAIPMR